MLQPFELRSSFQIRIAAGVFTTTTSVWDILKASFNGQLDKVIEMVKLCPSLIYAQYNYTPPIHFAVREGHDSLVKYLLENGALDPTYVTYPFNESLLSIAKERGYLAIAQLLQDYLDLPGRSRHKGDNGEIIYERTSVEKEFEQAVDKEDLEVTQKLLKKDRSLALNPTFFWSEGILTMPAKEGNIKMLELLMSYGATVPTILKWAQFYYFERDDSAAFLLGKGMNPNTQSWHHVTLLHDMAQKGDLLKAGLLLRYGADINAVEEEYKSTPLGLAARWGNSEMVNLLLSKGANPNKSGAPWATPLAWAKTKGHKEIQKKLQLSGAR